MPPVQSNAPTSKFVCRLINTFGDGHNHELQQYEETCNILKEQHKSDGILRDIDCTMLGNVWCNKVSLDSLLLTPQGIYIIEYKHYTGNITTISIDGQKNFICLDANDKPVCDSNGDPLKVKGGTFANPYEQAKANRKTVIESLKKCFNGDENKKFDVKVIILFPGDTKIISKGLSDDWLMVTNKESLIGYLGLDIAIGVLFNNGLTASQQETFCKYLDANKDVMPTIDPIKQVDELCHIGSTQGDTKDAYDTFQSAYKLLNKCDKLSRDTIKGKMQVLYLMGATKYYTKSDKDMFIDMVTRNKQSNDNLIKSFAHFYHGWILLHGFYGFKKDKEAALKEFYEIKTPTTKISEFIKRIEKEIAEEKAKAALEEKKAQERQQAQARERERQDKEYKNQYNRTTMLRRIGEEFYNAGREVASMRIILPIVFGCCIMLKYPLQRCWSIALIAAIVASVVFFWAYLICRDEKDLDRWFIRKKPVEHFKNFDFRLIKLENKWEDYEILKTALLFLAFLLIMCAPFVLSVIILTKGADYFTAGASIQKINAWFSFHASLNPFSKIIFFAIFYFVINIVAYSFAFIMSVIGEISTMYDTSSNRISKYYSIPAPDLQKKSIVNTSLRLCKRSYYFALMMLGIVTLLTIIKPHIYSFFSHS